MKPITERTHNLKYKTYGGIITMLTQHAQNQKKMKSILVCFRWNQGTVIIIANHGDRIDIPPGAMLENKIVSGNLRILDH